MGFFPNYITPYFYAINTNVKRIICFVKQVSFRADYSKKNSIK